jgi:hypothetical protein
MTDERPVAELTAAVAKTIEIMSRLGPRFAAASADELPALGMAFKAGVQAIVDACMAPAALAHLPPARAEATRTELQQLGDQLQASASEAIAERWAQLTGDGEPGTNLGN